MIKMGIQLTNKNILIGAVLALGTLIGSTAVMAQDATKAPAKAKAKFKPWIKLCPKVAKGAKKICMVRADYLDRANGVPYAPVSIEQVEGAGERLVVTLPHIWLMPAKVKNKEGKEVKVIRPVSARWKIGAGVQVKVDKGKTYKLTYSYCDNFGCVAQVKADAELIGAMKKGNQIQVAGISGPRPLGLPFTLQGFAKAYDGKPVSQEIYEKAWKKKLIAIRKMQLAELKRRREAKKKKK